MKKEVFETVKQAMASKQQCFVLCPAIESSEEIDLKNVVDMAERLKKLLTPPYRVGVIHGRMDPQERENIMDRFRKGGIDLLVATTVIEVGIHVPGATVMVIEDPERFGLAQLHQLRGRVGRGPNRGICILMVSENLTEKALSRLKVLEENHDGFDIAQKDLELRGQGELIGLRQAGAGELDFHEIMREQDLFLQAKAAAESLLDDDPELTLPGNEHLRAIIESFLSQKESAGGIHD
jgi:ATP-dependent DNA helicase RecG